MNDKDLALKLAALITIAAAVWFILDQIFRGRACCDKCSKGAPTGFVDAPARKGACV